MEADYNEEIHEILNFDVEDGMVMSRSAAEEELSRWFNLKRIKKSARKSKDYEAIRETIIDSFEDGTLAMNDEGVITQKLSFQLDPVDKGVPPIKELSHKLRVRAKTLNNVRKAFESSDGNGQIVATISAVTSVSSSIIGELDSTDFSIARAIAMFFFVDPENFDNMIKSVVRHTNWPPEKIDDLFIDAVDYHGLEYWYNDAVECQKDIERQTK